MKLLTDKETKNLINRLKADTDNQHKEKMLYAYAFYKVCIFEIEKVLPELQEYGLV